MLHSILKGPKKLFGRRRRALGLIAAAAIPALGVSRCVMADAVTTFTITTTSAVFSGADAVPGGGSLANGGDSLTYAADAITYYYDATTKGIFGSGTVGANGSVSGPAVTQIDIGTFNVSGTAANATAFGGTDTFTLDTLLSAVGIGSQAFAASANVSGSVIANSFPPGSYTDSFNTSFGAITPDPATVLGGFLPIGSSISTVYAQGSGSQPAYATGSVYLSLPAPTPVSTPLPVASMGGAGLLGLLGFTQRKKFPQCLA